MPSSGSHANRTEAKAPAAPRTYRLADWRYTTRCALIAIHRGLREVPRATAKETRPTLATCIVTAEAIRTDAPTGPPSPACAETPPAARTSPAAAADR